MRAIWNVWMVALRAECEANLEIETPRQFRFYGCFLIRQQQKEVALSLAFGPSSSTKKLLKQHKQVIILKSD